MKNTLIGVLAVLLIITAGYLIKGNNDDDKQDAQQTDTTNVSNGNNVTTVTGKVLNLSGQGLTKTPMYVFDRTDIEELNLSNNRLDGALQSQVQKLQNLKVLNLSNNKFTGVPAEVGQLKNLEVLNLSNNFLTGLPNELGNLSKLKLLDLSGNNYSEMDLAGIRKSLPASTVIKTK
jgi:Leucine-rich repeat (LRR) protein